MREGWPYTRCPKHKKCWKYFQTIARFFYPNNIDAFLWFIELHWMPFRPSISRSFQLLFAQMFFHHSYDLLSTLKLLPSMKHGILIQFSKKLVILKVTRNHQDLTVMIFPFKNKIPFFLHWNIQLKVLYNLLNQKLKIESNTWFLSAFAFVKVGLIFGFRLFWSNVN
jgi:hypothetical protein